MIIPMNIHQTCQCHVEVYLLPCYLARTHLTSNGTISRPVETRQERDERRGQQIWARIKMQRCSWRVHQRMFGGHSLIWPRCQGRLLPPGHGRRRRTLLRGRRSLRGGRQTRWERRRMMWAISNRNEGFQSENLCQITDKAAAINDMLDIGELIPATRGHDRFGLRSTMPRSLEELNLSRL